MTRPGWDASADFGALPSPDWLARGRAHDDDLRDRGGLPDCEMRAAEWTRPETPRCTLCGTPEPTGPLTPGWQVLESRDYCPRCVQFHVAPV